MSQSQQTAPLPAASQPAGPPPGSLIVYFDGVCGMCNSLVDFLIQRDRRRRFRFAPLQGETAAHLNIPEAELLKSLVVEDQSGIHRKSSAAWRIFVGLGGFWAVLGYLLWVIPAPLRNLGYDIVAHRRYRWFGKKETCRLPSPAERALFLP